MKINESGRIGAVNSYKRMTESAQAQSSNKKGKKDEVLISSEAKELLGFQNADNVQRTQKIDDLKQAVSTGTYHVDAGKIAEKLWPYIRD